MTGPADNTPLCPVCGLAPQVRGCESGKCRGGVSGVSIAPDGTATLEMGGPRSRTEGANDNAVEHPLPWRWVEFAVGGNYYRRMVDADGNELITGNDTIEDPYVRAVTERAGALDKALREVTASLASYLGEHDGDWKGSGYEDAIDLLVEIDMTKAGG